MIGSRLSEVDTYPAQTLHILALHMLTPNRLVFAEESRGEFSTVLPKINCTTTYVLYFTSLM